MFEWGQRWSLISLTKIIDVDRGLTYKIKDHAWKLSRYKADGDP